MKLKLCLEFTEMLRTTSALGYTVAFASSSLGEYPDVLTGVAIPSQFYWPDMVATPRAKGDWNEYCGRWDWYGGYHRDGNARNKNCPLSTE